MKSRKDIISFLVDLNSDVSLCKIVIYVDNFIDYKEASENIIRNGIICAHPKTGAPIENPYLKVRLLMQASLSKIRIDTGELWLKYSSEKDSDEVKNEPDKT